MQVPAPETTLHEVAELIHDIGWRQGHEWYRLSTQVLGLQDFGDKTVAVLFDSRQRARSFMQLFARVALSLGCDVKRQSPNGFFVKAPDIEGAPLGPMEVLMLPFTPVYNGRRFDSLIVDDSAQQRAAQTGKMTDVLHRWRTLSEQYMDSWDTP